MDFLKQFGRQVEELFQKLSMAQRLSVVMLAATMVLALIMLIVWSGGSQFEPLFTNLKDVDPDFIQRVTAKLDELAIEYQHEADTILVAKGKRGQAMASLSREQLLPQPKNIWGWLENDSLTETEPRLYLKQMQSIRGHLEMMISAFPEVKAARLNFTPPKRRREILYEHEVNDGKAAVMVELKWGQERLSEKTWLGIANLVSSAIPNLPVHHVQISDSAGNSYSAPDPGDALSKAGLLLAQKKSHEDHLEDQVLKHLGNIAPDVSVVVSVTLVDETTEIKQHKIDPDNFTKEHDWSRDENTLEKRPQGVPGVIPNAAATIPGGPEATGETVLKEQENWKDFDKTDTTTTVPPGSVKTINASVILPLHQFPGVKRKDGEVDLEAAENRALMDGSSAALKTYRDVVAKALQIKNTQTDIALYALPYVKERQVREPTAFEKLLSFLESYGAQMFLGFVTIIALILIFTSVRRAIPQPEPVLLAEEESEDEDEKDEDVLLAERMLSVDERKAMYIAQKVKEMVGQHPDSAARLVKAWLWHDAHS